MTTPRMTQHARERCEEMGISTKVAKRIVRNPSIISPGNKGSGCLTIVSDLEPGYIVVVDAETQDVVTVAFRTTEVYRRNGATFEVVE